MIAMKFDYCMVNIKGSFKPFGFISLHSEKFKLMFHCNCNYKSHLPEVFTIGSIANSMSFLSQVFPFSCC